MLSNVRTSNQQQMGMQRSIAKEYFDQREEIKNGYDEIGVLNAKIIYLNRQIQLKELEIKR